MSTTGPSEPGTPESDWLGLCASELPVQEAGAWLVRPDCGATVVFTGTARDHAAGRPGVDLLHYEAYETQAAARIARVAAEARVRWPELGRLVILHRTGDVPVTHAAVVVGASSAHREMAFAAARYCIDAVKATVPIWKRERWSDGDDWGLDGASLLDPSEVAL